MISNLLSNTEFIIQLKIYNHLNPLQIGPNPHTWFVVTL